MWFFVERGQQLIEEVGRYDSDTVVLAKDLVGTPFSGGADEVTRRLTDQIRGVLDPLFGLRPDPKLKSI